MGQIEQSKQGESLAISPEVHRAIVREIKLRLLRKLREDGRITEGEYDRLSSAYHGGKEWSS